MPNRELQSLLAPWSSELPYCPLRELVLDSRKVAAGDLFIALLGHEQDGRDYIRQAIAQGAVAVVAEAQGIVAEGTVQQRYGVPVVYLQDLNQRLSALAGRFYADEQHSVQVVGVTGTNGKSSTTHLLAEWCAQLGHRSAVMGTLGNGPVGRTEATENTTGSAIEIQQILAQWAQQGVQFTAMEISSHGLVQARVAALPFAAAVLTNVTRDHLDYHGTLAQYVAAKWRLFSEHQVGQPIINADDAVGRQWLSQLPNAVAVTLQPESLRDWPGRWVAAQQIDYHTQGVTVEIHSSWGRGLLESRLLGHFNVSNLLLALATLLALDHSLPALLATADHLSPIRGRLEPFSRPDRPTVVVDYAHTPDALEQALAAIRLHYSGEIWCLFGCGGDRDRGKRPLMGAVAEQGADKVILTTDNPRSEDPDLIIQQILSGILDPGRIRVIADRSTAVASVVMQAPPQAVVLVAGKGHEDYQLIGSRRLAHSDRHLVAQLLGMVA